MVHHLEMLGAGEPKEPFLLGAITKHFNFFQKPRRLLDFINQNRRLVPLKEQRRVPICQVSRHQVVHGHIDAAGPFSQMLQHGGLPHLPRTGNKEHFEEIIEPQKFPFQISMNISHSHSST